MLATFKRTHGWSYSLKETYCKQLHADVTIISEGRKLLVHRSVLASLSPFFKTLLSSNETNEPVISMEGFKYSVLGLLLQFSYQGHVNGSQEEILLLFKYAKELKVEGLINSSRKPVISDLLDTRSAAAMELKKLQTIDSDSDSCSSEDEDISILFENLERDKRPPSVTQTVSEKVKKTKANNIAQNQTEKTGGTAPSPYLVVHPSEKKQPELANPRKRPKLASSNPVPDLAHYSTSLPLNQGKVVEATREPVPKAIKCSVCKQIFALKHELRVHLNLRHAEILTCRICDKLFHSRTTLKRHLHKHIEKLDLMIGAAGPPS